MSHLTTLAVQSTLLLGTLLAVYTVSRLIYNVFLHPLRKFPGPLLAGATVLVYHRQSLKGKLPFWIKDLHQKYGLIVRFAPNEISTIEPQAWKDIYSHRATAWTKDKGFYGKDIYGDPPGLIRADNAAHGRQRKLVSHAFSDKALREQETILKGYVMLLIRKLKESAAENNGKVNLVDWYNFTTFDIMADLTFGESLELLYGSSYSPWVKALFDNIKLVQLMSVLRQYPPLTGLLNMLIPAHIKEKRQTVIMHSVDKVQKRLQRQTSRPDIWSYILRHSSTAEFQGKGLHPTEMKSNGSLFMLAGTETTATELSGLSYYLLHDKQRYTRLTTEIRTAFPRYEDMSMHTLADLKYLNACIDEGLRMYPPVSQGLPRTAPPGGAQVGSHFIPGGANVQVAQLAAYHSPLHWKNPERFVPERWMEEGEGEYGGDRRDVWNPFSYGPRNCLGKNLAYHEMRLVLASVLWYYDLEMCEESEGWLEQDVYLLWCKGSLMVRLRPIRD
ncbi:cytochrome P450 [Polyplosphaeria fusca]|uniref:Cytochrome P450 n=1 Tax=Polyplosphaeria fusca TaxID=682080 RepID=A0A9P4QSL8_9PLEO|nr:cytochrome P450 [Polyplosphaeria fusca]